MSQVNYTLVFGPDDGTYALTWFDYMYERRHPSADVCSRSMIEAYVEGRSVFGFTVVVRDGGVSNILYHSGGYTPEYMMRQFTVPPTSLEHIIDFRNWSVVMGRRGADLARLLTVPPRDGEPSIWATPINRRYGAHPVRSKRRNSLEVLPLP